MQQTPLVEHYQKFTRPKKTDIVYFIDAPISTSSVISTVPDVIRASISTSSVLSTVLDVIRRH